MFSKKIIVFSLLALVFTGCSDSEQAQEQAPLEQELIMGIGGDPSYLDPQLSAGLPAYKVHLALFEGLTTPDPDTLEPMPGVAKSWDISDDGKTYTFHLRGDAKWSNGDPVTAQDFVFSWRRILNPQLGADYAHLLYYIKGARAYHQGEAPTNTLAVSAVDTHTLKVELENATSYFLKLLFHNSYMPVHRATIQKHGGLYDIGNQWTLDQNHVGNGPFKLQEWSPSEHLLATKNQHYWDAQTVRLEGIRFLPISDRNTEERTFRAGQMHVTDSVPLAKIQTYREKNPELLRINPWVGVYYYLLNTTKPPLDDVRVRKALAMTLDRGGITEFITKGGQAPAYNFTPPIAGYESRVGFAEDYDAARKLLADAGYPQGKGFPTLELLYNDSDAHRVIAEAAQQLWKKELGIDITLRNVTWKSYLDQRRQKDFDIARAGWIGDYVDPSTFLKVWTSTSGNNHSGWSDPEYDRLIKQAEQTVDQAERYELFQEAEAIFVEAMPAMPIYFYTRVYLVQPEVKNWANNILDLQNYKYVELER